MGKVTIIQVRAPTENSSVADKDTFYQNLQRIVDSAFNKNRSVVIRGDLNARTGRDYVSARGIMDIWGGESTNIIMAKTS